MIKLIKISTMVVGLSAMALNPASARDPFAAMMAGESSLQGKKLKKALEKAAQYPLGSEQNPVRVDHPAGQHAYLERLRCANGEAPAYSRGGSVGLSPYEDIMDVYSVRCGVAETGENNVYMDMYHRGHIEERAVPGFEIVAP